MLTRRNDVKLARVSLPSDFIICKARNSAVISLCNRAESQDGPGSIRDKLGQIYFVHAVVEVPVKTQVHGMTCDVTTEFQSL